MLTIEEIKDFLSLDYVKDSLISASIEEAARYMLRYNLDPLTSTAEADTISAHKYLTAYFLLPQLSAVVGEKGMTKSLGLGENAQSLISEADLERKQTFYFNHAMKLIEFLSKSTLPFGIDI
ncbi:MAG: hypothetical protein PHF36_08170 [Candidatus Cloacimonetes bacterium]|nr:hypothetical protein [Candidatus Cloacimonadota bacterium]